MLSTLGMKERMTGQQHSSKVVAFPGRTADMICSSGVCLADRHFKRLSATKVPSQKLPQKPVAGDI